MGYVFNREIILYHLISEVTSSTKFLNRLIIFYYSFQMYRAVKRPTAAVIMTVHHVKGLSALALLSRSERLQEYPKFSADLNMSLLVKSG